MAAPPPNQPPMTRLVPPAPTPPATRNPLQFFRAVRRNLLEAFYVGAYDDLIVEGRVLGRRATLLSDPAAVRRVLVENAANYVKPVAGVRLIRPFTGAGLLLTEGEVWRRQRRRLAHVFTPSSLDALLPRFDEAADALVRAVEGRDTVNLARALEGAALDAVMRALFSTTADGWRDRLAALARDYLSGSNSAGRPNLLDLIARSPDDFAAFEGARRSFQRRWFAEVDGLIAARRAEPPRAEPDLLDHLLAARDAETGQPLAPEEVRSQIATFLAAGFETTSRLLFWTVYLLTLDPAEQARVRAELTADPGPATTLADLQRWPRLRCLLQESLRLYPPVPLIIRRALADDRAGEVRVSAGQQVTISPWVMHRHRRLWDDPGAFRPERFEGKPQAHLTGGAYLPFSAGPRTCIGASFAMAEATVLLSALLRRFEITLPDPRPVMPVAVVSIQPDHQPRFRLTPVAAPLRSAA